MKLTTQQYAPAANAATSFLIADRCTLVMDAKPITWRPAIKLPEKPKGVEIKRMVREQPFMAEAFAKACKAERTKKGLSMRQTADGAGISDPSYLKIEHGIVTKPQYKTVTGLAYFLGLDIENYYEVVR